MIELKDGIRSLVKIDFSGRVHKIFRGTDARARFDNEIAILAALEQRGCPYVPRLLESYPNELYFVSTNCGASAEPFISKRKADALFAELETTYGIRHDDPEPRNVTYDEQQGRFCLIDFELGEILPFPQSSHPSVTRLRWAAQTVQGRRHLTNQDSMLCLVKDQQRSHEATHGEIIFPTDLAFFCVSDGVGGSSGGEFASKLVVSKLRYELERNRPPFTPENLHSLIEDTHQQLNEQAQRNSHAAQLGATIVSLLFQGPEILWAHAGDSRLYRWRGGTLTQLSQDHNFAFRQWKRGELTELEYRLHPRNNMLYEALGGGHQNVNPEVGHDRWEVNDRYLLCSDGITEGLWDRKLADYLSRSEPAEQLTQRIHREAVQAAGDDDTSVIILTIT